MKRFAVASLIVLSVTASSSIFAAQDQLVIEQARKNQLAHDVHEQEVQRKPAPSTATKLVLPLDHGPHAQVTPWFNEQRRLRAEAEAKKILPEPDKSNQNASGK